MTAIYSRLH